VESRASWWNQSPRVACAERRRFGAKSLQVFDDLVLEAVALDGSHGHLDSLQVFDEPVVRPESGAVALDGSHGHFDSLQVFDEQVVRPESGAVALDGSHGHFDSLKVFDEQVVPLAPGAALCDGGRILRTPRFPETVGVPMVLVQGMRGGRHG